MPTWTEHRPYEKAITNEYNRWAVEYARAVKESDLIAISVAAFMCNKISLGVLQSSNDDLKVYFDQHRLTDEQAEREIAEQVEFDEEM